MTGTDLESGSTDAIDHAVNNTVHYICCDPTTAICGQDVTRASVVDIEATCPMCCDPDAVCRECGF